MRRRFRCCWPGRRSARCRRWRIRAPRRRRIRRCPSLHRLWARVFYPPGTSPGIFSRPRRRPTPRPRRHPRPAPRRSLSCRGRTARRSARNVLRRALHPLSRSAWRLPGRRSICPRTPMPLPPRCCRRALPRTGSSRSRRARRSGRSARRRPLRRFSVSAFRRSGSRWSRNGRTPTRPHRRRRPLARRRPGACRSGRVPRRRRIRRCRSRRWR